MWTRRDFLTLAAAAVATCGITLAIAYPRLANAVNQTPAATVNINAPTLDLGTAQVTAARDEKQAGSFIFTVKNTSDQPAKAEFVATILEMPPADDKARDVMLVTAWSQEFAVDLQPAESKSLAATPAYKSPPVSQLALANSIPGSRFLTMSKKAPSAPKIQALSIAPAPAPAPVANPSPKAPS